MSDDTSFKSFKLLNPYLKDNVVFFTGEAHGMVINYELQVKFLEYFNAKAGVRYFLQEYSHSYAILLNKYLETGDESILKRLYEPTKGTAGWSKQSYEMWKKVYDYNCSLPKDKKITIVGIDIEHQFQNAVWGMYYLLPDKEPPYDIKPLIDDLKNLYGNKIDVSSNDVLAFSKKLKDSIHQYSKEYEAYLGDSLFDFQMINDNILNADEAYAANHNGIDMQDFNEIRDKKMYENFLRVYSHLPKGKYFGQFGASHVMQGTQDYTNWLASLMNKPGSPVEKKVLSIVYAYKDCQYMARSNGGYSVRSFSSYNDGDGLMEPYLKGDLVLFRLSGKNSPFENSLKWYLFDTMPMKGVTTDYYQFILFIKGAKPTTPLGE
jgi:hypothetical protein